MIQMLKRMVNLMIPKFAARNHIIRSGTYKKYGFVVTLSHHCYCPRCNHILNAGPDYQPKYCDRCGQRVDCSNVSWKEDVTLGYAREEESYEPVKN